MSELMQEIKQVKPFRSKEEEVFLNLLRTTEALRTSETDLFKPYDLTPVQYNVLRILRGAEPGGLTCSEISSRLITKDSDITRLLDRLEARGLVARCRHEKDRRAVLARISEKGLTILAELDEPVLNRIKSMLGHLGADLLDQFNALLVLARKSVNQQSPANND